jgi:hypothetical protein
MSNKYERFVSAYLRLNAYFAVQNFVVHAGDDPTRVSSEQVGNYTECDTLAIRMPHSNEVAGALQIAPHRLLTDGARGRLDVVIAEAKSGNKNRPNRVWRAGTPDPAISYVVRFNGMKCSSRYFGLRTLTTAISNNALMISNHSWRPSTLEPSARGSVA